ncbi:MAG: ABC transporter permease [Muribaculum sp.]|nr:ABC transporter permease [Muribaculum sp.]
MARIIENIKTWWSTLFRAWIKEYWLVFHDAGVLLFFFALPLAYPITYTLIYNPELADEIPMAIVDDCRSSESRELARMIDATQYIDVAGYASDIGQAKEWMKERKVYSVLHIPSDYSQKLGRMEQAVLPLYCDMSLMIRYRNILFAITDVTLQLDGDIRTQTIDESPIAFAASSMGSAAVDTQAFILGDPSQGFASFIMIGLVVLILQQSLILGVLMLGGASNERRRKNFGIDPEMVAGPMSASVLGRAMCYFTIYAPLVVYIFHYVPLMFRLPAIGDPMDYLLFIVPMVFASVFLGQILRPLATERESSFLIFVFTSVLFLFLSGITWPTSAMAPVWRLLSGLIPASWGIQGFVGINSNGATLSEVSTPYLILWAMAVVYYFMAVVVEKRASRIKALIGSTAK